MKLSVAKNFGDDREFPYLAEIMNTQKIAKQIQHFINSSRSEDRVQVKSCTIHHLYYKPGEKCRILLTAEFYSQQRKKVLQQNYFGQLIRLRNKKKLMNSINIGSLVQPPVGPPVIRIPVWNLILWAFPNDPELPGLPVMADSAQIFKLSSQQPEKFGLNRAPAKITVKRLKYVPGMRCSFIYQMTLPDSDKKGPDFCINVFGKTYRRQNGLKAYSALRQIWLSPECQNRDFIVPELYGYDAGNQILWQEAFTGQSIEGTAFAQKTLPEVSLEIGKRLAMFHNSHILFQEKMTLDSEISELKAKVSEFNASFPQFARNSCKVAQKLIASLNICKTSRLTPIHSSFKLSHIFMTQKGIAFIDLDGAQMGDPCYDLGRFIAHLFKMEVQKKLDADIVEKTIGNFCKSYNKASKNPVSQNRIHWQAADHLLVSQVFKSVKRRDASLVSALIQMADQLCPI